MTAVVFDGEKEASQRERALAKKVGELKKKGETLKLVSVVVGEDRASHLYVNLKGEAAELVGIEFEKLVFSPETAATLIQRKIREKCAEAKVTGVMVQLPLPKRLGEETVEILAAIAPGKDVDCLHPDNLGRLLVGKPRFLPATVRAVVSILDEALQGSTLQGRKVVVVGRSNIVGKPLAAYLTNQDAVVTVAHSKTKNLGNVTRQAEILVSATGRAGLITNKMVKPGAVVIDVGEPEGDVDFEAAKEIASFITPVPGGVGPMTVVSLLENVVSAARVV